MTSVAPTREQEDIGQESDYQSPVNSESAEVAKAAHLATPLAALLERAQADDEEAVEALLQQFQPLLRSRMHQVWSKLQEQLPSVEWADVEAQIYLMFLRRLQDFRRDGSVYFPHYITRMLDLDCRAWLRQQRRRAAVPFSQLTVANGGSASVEDWLGDDAGDEADATANVERAMSLQAALHTLTERQRQVVWECCVLGRPENQVAAQLGISRSAVRNRLSSAISHMRSFFREQDDRHGMDTGWGDLGDELAASATRSPTRTGRAVPQPLALQRELWIRRINMARDERRPDLVGVGAGRPVLLQGVFDFEATDLKTPQLLSPKLSYTVPDGCVVGIRYFRVGVSCEKMICLSTIVNGDLHRMFPVAPNSTMHISLAIVEPIIAGSQIEIHVAAAAPGTAILDVGCLQMPA